jgi:hypothetical protein
MRLECSNGGEIVHRRWRISRISGRGATHRKEVEMATEMRSVPVNATNGASLVAKPLLTKTT